MHSNLKKTYAALVAALVFTSVFYSGCGWVKDQPKAQISFQTQNLNCLNKLSGQIESLFAGKYTDSPQDQAEIHSAFDCLNYGLKTFVENTRGDTPTQYTANELRSFANRYLDKNKAISRELIEAVFSLKSAILGGNAHTLTKKEIGSLMEVLNNFRDAIKPLASQIKFLIKPKDASDAQRAAACKRLDVFVSDLSEILENTNGPIAWKNLSTFIVEFEKYISNGETSALTVLSEQLPLLQYFKLLLVGGDEFSIEKNKWRPILLSVASVYSALNFENFTVKLDALNMRIESTDQEQRRAVTKINALLKTLKDDTSLHTHDTIVMISDNWAKALLANSILFPSMQGSIALKPILDSPVIRKLGGYILDQAMKLETTTLAQEDIVQLSEYAQSLIEQTAIAIEPDAQSQTSFSVAAFKEYAATIKPLFKNDDQYLLFVDGIDIVQNVRSILLGKSVDTIRSSELKELIKKVTELYVIWNSNSSKKEKSATMNSLSQTLEVALRSPSAFSIKMTTALETITKIKELLVRANIKNDVPWNKIHFWIQKGFALKGLLFANADDTLYSIEVKKVMNLLEPFRNDEKFDVQLAQLASLLKASPFATVDLGKLLAVAVPLYESFDAGKPPFALTVKNVAIAKALLLGGTKERLEQVDYSLLVLLASKMMSNVEPITNSLPKDFQTGLNAKTMELASTALQTLADFQRVVAKQKESTTAGIDLVNLRELLLIVGPSLEFDLVPKHIDEFLTGFTWRVLQKQKGPKPTVLSGAMLPEHLEIFVGVIKKINAHLVDLERVYANVDLDHQPLEGKYLKENLKDPLLLEFLNTFRPQLMGKDHIFMQPKLGETFTRYYYFDIAIKVLIKEALNIVLPAYKIDKDEENLERVSLKDLTDLLQDLNNLLVDIGISFAYENPAFTASKRMITINSFTLTGNGDSWLEPTETIDFLTMSIGGGVLLNGARELLTEKCFPGQNWKKVKEFPAECFLPTYFSSDFYMKVYGSTLPQMAHAVSIMNKEELENFKISTLITAKPDITNKPSYNLDDLQSIALLPEYIESIYIRLDKSQDAVVQFSEAMAGFPLFCQQILDGSKGKLKGSCKTGYAPNQIEAIYGFMLMNGEAPRGPKPGDSIWRKVREAAAMLKWFRTWKKMNKDPAYRDTLPPQITRKDLMTLLANLSLAAPLEIPPEDDQTSSEAIFAF